MCKSGKLVSNTTDAFRKTHVLKTWPYYWDAIETGAKTFEVRRGDRPYHVGDYLELRRYDPKTETYTKDCPPIVKRVSFVMSGMGLEPGYVAMGLQDI
jgi:hypothetical protein